MREIIYKNVTVKVVTNSCEHGNVGECYLCHIDENKPCPRCSNLTVEGLAKVMFDSTHDPKYMTWERSYEGVKDSYRKVAQAVFRYIKEGK